MCSVHGDVMDARESRPAKRFFSPAEADRALVLVRRIVADVVSEYARLVDSQEALEATEASCASDCCERTKRALLRSAGRLRSCLAELDDVGVELKDWETGVVDFACIVDGRQIYLCWRHGEDRVAHWHDLDADFAGRQPIETLPGVGVYVGDGEVRTSCFAPGRPSGCRRRE